MDPVKVYFLLNMGRYSITIAMLVYQRVVYLPVVRNCREVNRRCGRSPSRIVPIQFGSGVPEVLENFKGQWKTPPKTGHPVAH